MSNNQFNVLQNQSPQPARLTPAEARAIATPLDDWDAAEDTPELLIGHRLAIQWAGGKWYSGTCTQYDAQKGEHYIWYDDNDTRWYRMTEKVCRSVLPKNP